MSLRPPRPGQPGFKEWQDLADACDAVGVLGAGAVEVSATDGERDLAALCARLVRRLREVAPDDKLAATATDYLSQRRYLNPLRIRALDASGVTASGDQTKPGADVDESRKP